MTGRARRARLAVLLWSGVAVAGSGAAVFLWSQGLERAGWWSGVGALVVALVTLLCQFPVFRGSRPEPARSGGTVHDNSVHNNIGNGSVSYGDHQNIAVEIVDGRARVIRDDGAPPAQS